jgi:arsenite methyltransferase
VTARYYGCGLVCPPLLEGCRVLDLGCGSGRDVYALAQMAGESGQVVGVDMTEEQLAVAERHREHHREAFGYARDNVEFRLGYIERLDELGLERPVSTSWSRTAWSISPRTRTRCCARCIACSSPAASSTFPTSTPTVACRRAAQRPGAVRRMPGRRAVLERFSPPRARHGFADPRLVEDLPIAVTDPALAARTAGIGFYSATYRLFKLDGLEPDCEDYGQAVVYRGGIIGHERRFVLDKHHVIEAGRVFPVCGNTWRMLHDSRFAANTSISSAISAATTASSPAAAAACRSMKESCLCELTGTHARFSAGHKRTIHGFEMDLFLVGGELPDPREKPEVRQDNPHQ